MGKLLVVVDYQKDFVDGSLGFEKAVELEKSIYDKVNKYLAEGEKVLFTYDTHHENYLETREGKNLPVIHCIEGTEGHDLYGSLKEFKKARNTYHYNKGSFGISPTDMIRITEEIGEEIESIELIGVVTNMCVVSNVVTFQSQYTNADISVNGALCASFDEALHDKALDVIESLQVKVVR